jgi:hypothetical protein
MFIIILVLAGMVGAGGAQYLLFLPPALLSRKEAYGPQFAQGIAARIQPPRMTER